MPFTEHRSAGPVYDTADGLSALGGIRHAFTTRLGGVSPAPFESLNFASGRGDSEENLLQNYLLLGNAVGFDVQRAAACRQIHSDIVHLVTPEDAGKLSWDDRPCDADALITDIPELPIVVFGSDCCTLLLCDPVARCIGAAHAGWRGTASGIVAKTVEAMVLQFGANPTRIRAAIGPSIGKCCFLTDEDVPQAMPNDPAIRRHIVPVGTKYSVDLKAINREWLIKAGLLPEQIELHPDCTMCRPDRYWSHRLMGPQRGGMIAVICLEKRGER